MLARQVTIRNRTLSVVFLLDTGSPYTCVCHDTLGAFGVDPREQPCGNAVRVLLLCLGVCRAPAQALCAPAEALYKCHVMCTTTPSLGQIQCLFVLRIHGPEMLEARIRRACRHPFVRAPGHEHSRGHHRVRMQPLRMLGLCGTAEGSSGGCRWGLRWRTRARLELLAPMDPRFVWKPSRHLVSRDV